LVSRTGFKRLDDRFQELACWLSVKPGEEYFSRLRRGVKDDPPEPDPSKKTPHWRKRIKEGRMSAFEMGCVLFWFIFAFVVAIAAYARGRNGVVWFLGSV
jgi:hypothetical protein